PSPLGQALARVASVSLLLVAVAACLLPALRHGWATLKQSDLQRVEFLIVFVLCCLVSPLAWSHYYCWMLLPLTLLLADSALLITGSALLITGSAPSIAGSAPSIAGSAPSITSS